MTTDDHSETAGVEKLVKDMFPSTPVTIGRIMHYKLSAQDAEAINRRRCARPNWPEWPEGAIAHVGNTAREGDVHPMIVCRVWEPINGISAGINGQVFLDGNDTLWVTSRHEGDEPGAWCWPKRV